MLQIVRQTTDKVYALCPFHNDHDPSLVINLMGPYAGRFRCWACGAEGWASEFQQGFTVLQPATLPTPQFSGLVDDLIPARNSYDQLSKLAGAWGVPRAALEEYGVLWSWNASAYVAPMRNGFGELIGVHRRYMDGSKRCCPGSRLGLFLPSFYSGGPAVLCEGLSDTVCVASLGFFALGRASAMSCMDHICVWVSQHCHHSEPVVIVADSDEVGRKSAERIRDVLIMQGAATAIASVSPDKDARQMYNRHPDGLRQTIVAAIEAAKASGCP
jgi:hypothetical protein